MALISPSCRRMVGRPLATMGCMDELLEGLDDAQLAAATALEGPVRIIAGAGAGKTRTVTRRIAHAWRKRPMGCVACACGDVLRQGGR